MRANDFFSQNDLATIEAAVRRAESSTSGEIVPYVVGHSDHYEATAWKAAVLGVFCAELVAAVVHRVADVWGTFFDLWMIGPPVAGAALGILAAWLVPALKRALAGRHELAERVHQRAVAAFVEQQVFKTRDRTGILLFLSLFERRVEVLADVGIAASVKQEAWDSIVAEIVAGIRAGKPGAALASAIGRCGELLASHGVTIRPDDTDELPDQLRVREE